MANSVTITASLSFTGGGASIQRSSGSNAFSVTTLASVYNIQTIGTSDESLVLGEVGTPGYAILHNLDATNYVDIGPDGTNYLIRLKPTQWGVFPIGSAAVHAKANTAPCQLEYCIVSQ